MIVGNYYINNFLVLGLVLAIGGGASYVTDVPGMLDGGSSQERPSTGYNISLLGTSTESGSSQVIRFVGDDGSAISGAEVSVNGQEVGTTGESGEVAFEVPDSENLTVSASKSGVEVSRVFEVQDSQQSEDESSNSNPGGGNQGSNEDGSGQNQDSQQGNDNNETPQGSNSTEQGNETQEGNESSRPIFIDKVSPENSKLSSSSFELILKLGANNSNYRVSLGEEQKLSGQINGNKTVSSTLEMPRNGTVGLYVEIVKNGEVKASKNYSLSYREDTGSDIENNVTADISELSTVSIGEEFTLDASDSTGQIDNYTWQFGDGNSEITQSSEVRHIYDTERTYEISLTVEGPNNAQDAISISVSVESDSGGSTKAPEINFISPLDGYETDQSSIDYQFEVNNAEANAEYKIMIEQSAEASGTLEEGNSTIQETVQILDTPFNTSIQVTQGGKTYTSEKRTINPSNSIPKPDLFLRKPEEGSEYSSTEIGYNFTVYNGIEGSIYRIIANGNSVKTGQLSKDGTTTLSPTVTVPEGEFTTQVEIDQGGQTYTSESVTVVAGQTVPGPSVTFDHPSDGETVSETFDETTDVSLNYTVEDRGWAQEATLTLENYEGSEVGNRTHSVSSGQSYSYTFEDIPTYKQDSQAEYTWTIELTGNGKTTTLGPRSFLAERLEHIDVAELHSVERNETYSGVFNYSAMSNSRNGRILEITRNGTVIAQKTKFESFDINNRVEEFWIYETGQHNVQVILRDVSTDEVVAQSQTLQFETTELPPDAGGGGGS